MSPEVIQGEVRCACGERIELKYARLCLRCRSARHHRRSKWIPTPEIDALICQAWGDAVLHGKAASLYVQERTGWPRWRINRRAVAIGAARHHPKEGAWTTKEIGVLQQFAWMCLERIQMKLGALCGTHRTLCAIFLKRKRLKLLSNLDGYSATRLAYLLGEDGHKVTGWIKAGALKAERRGTGRTGAQGGDIYYIPHVSVRKFILTHPEEIDLAKIDRAAHLWFIDLISNGRAGGKHGG